VLVGTTVLEHGGIGRLGWLLSTYGRAQAACMLYVLIVTSQESIPASARGARAPMEPVFEGGRTRLFLRPLRRRPLRMPA
jgi:hypothetical protein